MQVFNGKKAAEEILWEIKEDISKKQLKPVLAIISVGKNPASEIYIRNKKTAAEKIGITINQYQFDGQVSEKEIIKKIEELDRDEITNGIIVQLPLPKSLKTDNVIGKISPKKDVDGFHKKNLDLLKSGENPYFLSPFLQAIFTALKSTSMDLRGKKVIAVVNSNKFGQSLKSFFKKQDIKIKTILKRKHYFLDIRVKLRSADVIITACGCIKELKGDMIKQGVILIDGGIAILSNGKAVGDMDRESVEEKAAFLTPVPGGIGPLTVAFLLKNVYISAKNKI